MTYASVVLSVCLMCLGGCATAPFESYPTESLSEQQVAIVSPAYLKKIVDESGNRLLDLGRYEYGEYSEYRLKPGKYWVQFDHWGVPSTNAADDGLDYSGIVEFQAGHRYEVKYEDCNIFDVFRNSCHESQFKSYMWLEDTGTGEVLMR